jgi:hypothetical protein
MQSVMQSYIFQIKTKKKNTWNAVLYIQNQTVDYRITGYLSKTWQKSAYARVFLLLITHS